MLTVSLLSRDLNSRSITFVRYQGTVAFSIWFISLFLSHYLALFLWIDILVHTNLRMGWTCIHHFRFTFECVHCKNKQEIISICVWILKCYNSGTERDSDCHWRELPLRILKVAPRPGRSIEDDEVLKHWQNNQYEQRITEQVSKCNKKQHMVITSV